MVMLEIRNPFIMKVIATSKLVKTVGKLDF